MGRSGRAGTSTLSFVGRRRRRWRVPALVVLAAATATALAGGALGGDGDGGTTGPSTATTDAAADPTPDGTDGAAGEPDGIAPAPVAGGSADDTLEVAPAPTTPPLSRVDGLELFLLAAEPVIVGYHEAAHVSAVPMTPAGQLVEDRNTTRTSLPPDDPAGHGYLVLTSRGRSAGPTSAVDIVLPEDVAVLAPVSGTVADVRDYQLYGRHPDTRIEIVPDARPDLRVVLIHVAGARVAVGDRVHAGVTPVAASARLFPFGSHIDRETEPDRYPHVHLELQPIDRPRPGDEVDEETDAPG